MACDGDICVPCACVCVCGRARARACVHACARVCVRVFGVFGAEPWSVEIDSAGRKSVSLGVINQGARWSSKVSRTLPTALHVVTTPGRRRIVVTEFPKLWK